ncbi:MAG: MFS transporter [Fusobacteriaceae bacterium]
MENNKKIDGNEIILGKDLSYFARGLAFFSIAIVYFFYCYNFMVGIFVKPTMIAEISNGGFGFTIQQTESIFAMMSFGTIPGTIFFGIITSKLGKKYTLSLVALFIAITTFLPMLDPTNYTVWKIARLITGFTLGGVFGTAMPLVADLFPQKFRGKLSAILTSLFSLAMIFGGQVYGVLGDANWNILMYTAIIPPAIGAVMIYFFVPNDYEQMKKLNVQAKESGKKISYISMYSGKYFWIGLGVILLSGANFTAYSAFSNNATTYLRNSVGLSAAVAGGIYSLQGIGQLIGYNFWGMISDKFGRKKPLIGMILCAICVFAYMKLGNNDLNKFKVISLLLGISVGFSGAWGAYYTELFPKEYSSLSAGISFNGGRIISTFAIPILAGLAVTAGDIPKIFNMAMFVFLAGAVVWLFLPETLNKKENFSSEEATKEI